MRFWTPTSGDGELGLNRLPVAAECTAWIGVIGLTFSTPSYFLLVSGVAPGALALLCWVKIVSMLLLRAAKKAPGEPTTAKSSQHRAPKLGESGVLSRFTCGTEDFLRVWGWCPGFSLILHHLGELRPVSEHKMRHSG